MQGVAVTLLTEDRERLTVLQHTLEGTGMGRNVFSHVGFPTSPTDPVLRQMQDVRTEVVIVDLDAQNAQRQSTFQCWIPVDRFSRISCSFAG